MPGSKDTPRNGILRHEMSTAYDAMAPIHIRPERDAALAWLRREDPVHWDAPNDWWLVTRHADIRSISTRSELFSSEPRGPWHAIEARFSMQAMDGRAHLRQRNIVSRAFTPRMVSMLTQRAEVYADEALAALGTRRSGDFVSDLAVPVPMRIIADMLGVADGDLENFRRWSDATVVAGGGYADETELAEATRQIQEFQAYMEEVVAKRRAQPGEDILSQIIRADDEGLLDNKLALEADEVRDFAFFLLIAGNETTRNGISQGMLALFEHPEQRHRLTADASLWATAPDEILRWTSPVRAMRRVALRDTTLRDREIREGQSVVMIYAAANRDEAVFDAPDEFRVDRTPNEHLALGIGPHYCMGANLARMEIRVVLRKILERLPELRLVPGTEPQQTHSALIDGLESLPVEW